MSMITIDCMGEQCPIPVVKTLKAINEMKEPGTIQTHVDNETAVQNLSKLAGSKNFPVKAETVGENHFVVTLESKMLKTFFARDVHLLDVAADRVAGEDNHLLW